MQTQQSIETALAYSTKTLQDTIEFAEIKRLNRGYDVDFEQVINKILHEEEARIGVLKWILESSEAAGGG